MGNLRSSSATARGGGGGGGGDDGMGMNGADGGNGADGPTTDGANGAGGMGSGRGKGGNKGADGVASAETISDGITEFAPDLQPLLGWSFAHTHSVTLEVKAGGGGGGGGAGVDVSNTANSTTDGGNGGTGEDSQAAALSAQASQIDLEGALGQVGEDPYPLETNFPVTAYATVGWGSSGVNNGMAGPAWRRGCNVVMVCGSVSLQFTGRDDDTLNALGSDDNGPFMRSSSSTLDSAIGELVVSPWELTGTANLGNTASIHGIASGRTDQFGNTVNSGAIGIPGELYRWNGSSYVLLEFADAIAASPIYSIATADESATGGTGGSGGPNIQVGDDGSPLQSNSPSGGLGGGALLGTGFDGSPGGAGGSIDLVEIGDFLGNFNIEVATP